MKNKFFLKTSVFALGYLLFSDILCLFIDLTIAVFSGTIFKIISTMCTSIIFVGLIINFAWTVKQKSKKFKSEAGENISVFFPFAIGIVLSVPYWIMWAVLFISKTASFEFYSVYKILNGQFLQVYNLMENGTDISLVSNSELMVMLTFTFIPLITFVIAYFYFERNSEEK